VVVEILDPIPPDLPKAEFLARLKEAIETASDRLLAEAHSESEAR
jgi:1-acyl-sn-glycerol-3-phosphate acyltransferase